MSPPATRSTCSAEENNTKLVVSVDVLTTKSLPKSVIVSPSESECVKLACPWCEGPAIKDEDGAGSTNPVRDITGNYRLENVTNNVALLNYKQNMIKKSDLDLISATTPCSITSTIYGTFGYRWDDREWPLFGNFGASYEFSHSHNGVPERWTIWAKLGVSL